MTKIAIIGTGKIGAKIAEILISKGICRELLLFCRSRKRLNGIILSLRIWASIIKSKTKIEFLKFNKINEIDLIIICLKENYDPRLLIHEEELPKYVPRNLRYIGLCRDLPQIEYITRKIKNYNGMVAVITNPVDVMSSFVQKWIPNASVYGLGVTLDSARLAYIVNKEYGTNYSSEDLLLGGEHGGNLIPLFDLWKTKKNIEKRIRNKLNKYLELTRNIGYDIVNLLGYSMHDCVEVFARDIEWLLGLKKEISRLSFSIWEENACIGMPVEIYDDEINHKKIVQIAFDEKKEVNEQRIMIAKTISSIEKTI